jgi:hypothetical protein
MSLRRARARRKALSLLLALVMGGPGQAVGQGHGTPCHAGLGPPCGSCDAAHCQRHDCPPPYRHCQEGPPRLRFKKACPRPVCPPGCDTPYWGYFQPCWRPWSWPLGWAHCPYPVPAATVALPPPGVAPAALPGQGSTPEQLPQPRPGQ